MIMQNDHCGEAIDIPWEFGHVLPPWWNWLPLIAQHLLHCVMEVHQQVIVDVALDLGGPCLLTPSCDRNSLPVPSCELKLLLAVQSKSQTHRCNLIDE